VAAPDLWLATCPGVGHFRDEKDVPASLASHGIVATYRPWQDIKPDGTPIVVRTAWDYTEHRDAFAAWLARIEATATPCWNPPARMRWNMDKRYLLELAAAGHDVVPTIVVEDFSVEAARAVGRSQGWPVVVAKPVVGAGGEGLVVLDGDAGPRTFDQAGLTWMRRAPQLPEGACLVQPFMSSIAAGEWSLFYFGGAYSHAILKRPKPGDVRVQEEHGGSTVAGEPAPSIRRAAAAIVSHVPDALYARVDGVVHDGRFLLMELELIEPELYFRYAPGAVARFAAAVASAVSDAT